MVSLSILLYSFSFIRFEIDPSDVVIIIASGIMGSGAVPFTGKLNEYSYN